MSPAIVIAVNPVRIERPLHLLYPLLPKKLQLIQLGLKDDVKNGAVSVGKDCS